jgi:hypothetical protein
VGSIFHKFYLLSVCVGLCIIKWSKHVISLCLLQVTRVLQVDDVSPLRFSMDTVFFTEKYEIV